MQVCVMSIQLPIGCSPDNMSGKIFQSLHDVTPPPHIELYTFTPVPVTDRISRSQRHQKVETESCDLLTSSHPVEFKRCMIVTYMDEIINTMLEIL